MLTIVIMPNCICFENLTDEIFKDLLYTQKLPLIVTNNEYRVDGDKAYLYDIILKLAHKYDIEIL